VSPETKIWIAVLGVGATAVVTRCSFLLFGERLVLPESVERALRLAPAAALAATLAPSVIIMDDGALGAVENPRFAAAIVAAIVMWASRQMLWSMAAGLAAYTAVRLLA
jgi:branched-subunit amino acid transport protein